MSAASRAVSSSVRPSRVRRRALLVLLGYLVLAVSLAFVIALWVIRTVLQPASVLVRLLSDSEEQPTPVA